MVHWSGAMALGNGAVAATAVGIAEAKVALPFGEAFFRGILCNTLVCLAVWLCFAAHDVASKVLAIVLPISAFIALGFEHSVANMYLVPVAWLSGAETITFQGFMRNLVPVTLGNITVGCLFVAAVCWVIYLRKSDEAALAAGK
jgi:formate/nitrite transporter